ncbi:MAG: glycosyltransferase family 2 protein [Sulfuriferula sp.]
MNLKNKIVNKNNLSVRLTVAIPTYNRNEILKSNLAKLIPQLTTDCELLILDNCSTVAVENTLNDLIASIPENITTRIIRHRANVGGNENILRCIEHAQGEFVWLLSDDDQPVDSAIANIFQELDNHPNALVLNMYAPCRMHSLRAETKIVAGSAGYLSSVSFLGELIFISSMVLRVDRALGNMSAAHLWQSSHAPQLIVAAMMLRPNDMAVISSREVVQHGGMTTPIESQGSVIPIALGFPTLMLAPWNEVEMRHILSLLRSARHKWITQKGVVNQLISLANQEGLEGRYLALRYFYLLRRNFFAIGHTLSVERVLYACAWPLVAWPKMGRVIRNVAWRIFKGVQYGGSKGPDINR